MAKSKMIFSLLCIALLAIWALHVFVRIDESEETVWRVGFPLLTLITPLLIGFIAFLFKKRLFHLFLWIGTAVIFLIFMLGYNAAKNFGSRNDKEASVVKDYFKSQAGFFTTYKSIGILYDYPDSLKNLHIAKILYRIGSKQAKTYYIGKLLLDNNSNVVKELYHQSVASDTTFFRKEFTNSYFLMSLVPELYR